MAVEPNEHDIQRICVGASLDHLLADVSRFDKLVLAASGSILLLSPLFGYLLAGRATRGVQIMSDTAAREAKVGGEVLCRVY